MKDALLHLLDRYKVAKSQLRREPATTITQTQLASLLRRKQERLPNVVRRKAGLRPVAGLNAGGDL